MIIKIVNKPGTMCRGTNCSNDPKYINENGRIRKDSPCAQIMTNGSTGYHSSYYCRNCLEDVLKLVKYTLDPKFWIFK